VRVINKNIITAFGCEIAVRESQERFQNMFLFGSMIFFFQSDLIFVASLKGI